jgi:hypothetical protein
MKKILIITMAALGAMFAITSCEDVRITLPESEFFVAFDYGKYRDGSEFIDSSRYFKNAPDTLKIPVIVAGKKLDNDVTVSFEIAQNDIYNSFTLPATGSYAQLGVDYVLVNPTQTLTFPKGAGTQYIMIKTLNSSFTGHKFLFFNITGNSAGYRIGMRTGTNNDTIVRASHRTRIY